MITEKQYLNLLDFANKKAKYFNKYMLLEKENGRLVEIDISGVDALHDSILKFPKANESELKKKISNRFVAIYFEVRRENDPMLKERMYSNWKFKYHTDKEYHSMWQKRSYEWSKNIMPAIQKRKPKPLKEDWIGEENKKN